MKEQGTEDKAEKRSEGQREREREARSDKVKKKEVEKQRNIIKGGDDEMERMWKARNSRLREETEKEKGK